MNKQRISTGFAGAFFLIAIVTSLAGGGILDPFLTPEALVSISTEGISTITAGAWLEMINALCVLGIAICLFPILEKFGKSAALGYVSFRILEFLACTAAAMAPVLAARLSGDGTGLNSGDSLSTVLHLLVETRSIAFDIFLPLFFCLGAFTLYFFIVKTGKMPRFIGYWGLASTAMIVIITFFPIPFSLKVMLALPIILNEATVGVWLLVKGFRKEL